MYCLKTRVPRVLVPSSPLFPFSLRFVEKETPILGCQVRQGDSFCFRWRRAIAAAIAGTAIAVPPAGTGSTGSSSPRRSTPCARCTWTTFRSAGTSPCRHRRAGPSPSPCGVWILFRPALFLARACGEWNIIDDDGAGVRSSLSVYHQEFHSFWLSQHRNASLSPFRYREVHRMKE